MKENSSKISLLGSVSLGTGVMIGAGIFVLMGQIAELVGGAFPLAFIAGAIIVGLSSYSYVKFSNAYPSSGGVVKFLSKAYKPGVATGTFSLLMYGSMVVAESLVAGTFGSYTMRLFPEEYAKYGTVLAVFLIGLAYIINVFSNKIIERTATLTAILKIGGITFLAVVGLIIGGFPNFIPESDLGGTSTFSKEFSFMAALALSILAYKGFTTITNQGGDIVNPHKNVGRSIIISITVCTLIYVLLAYSVSASLSVSDIIKSKDYALAEAAKPMLGNTGIWLTVVLAMIATFSGVLASVFSASRLLAMLSNMKQVPVNKRISKLQRPSLLFTVLLAMLLTLLFDLTRIASIGAIFYLIMDIAIHWGLVRFLRKEVKFKPIIPLAAILLDTIVLAAFVYLKLVTDPLILIVAGAGILLVIIAEKMLMRSHTNNKGEMEMGMKMDE